MAREDEPPVDIVTVGELTLDDTVLESGGVQRATCGGGALYAAAGAHVWGLRVGINAVVGAEDYPEEALLRIAAAGLDIRGIRRWPGPSLRLWILHEDGARKQQVVKLGAATFAELDAARGPLPASYRAARGWHLAPATPQGQRQALDELCARARGVITTLDLLVDPVIDITPYSLPAQYRGVTAFLPSRAEVERLWPAIAPQEVARRMFAWGPAVVTIKRDEQGSLVFDGRSGKLWEIPAYPAHIVDTTGAGDAYCGGFLAGLVRTDDPLVAGCWATISASFAVETVGALAVCAFSRTHAEQRLAHVRSAVQERTV